MRKIVLLAASVAAICSGTALAGTDTPKNLQGPDGQIAPPLPPARALPKGGTLPPPGAVTLKPAAANQDAQTVPAIDGPATPMGPSSVEVWEKAIATPPQGKISQRSKEAMEKALVSAYEAGKTQNLPPIAGTNGEVLYAYGQSLPTLVTAPVHTSLILLEPGLQKPEAIGLSPAYWSVQTIEAGNQPELAVTPRFQGLHGNLVVTGTSPDGKARNYVIEVTSDAGRYTPVIGFYYPDALVRHWKETAAAGQAFRKKVEDQTVALLPSIDPADLDFHWRIECGGGGWFGSSDCRAIEPAQVFDDGRQTFIRWKADQASHGGIPSVLAENAAGQNAIVNTRFRDGYTIVDGVPPKILLLAGKGSSARVVKLVHEGGQ